MVLNATFNNISVISWQSVLLVEYPVSYGIEPHGKLTPGSIFIHGILNPHGILTPAPISNQEMGREVKISWVGGESKYLG
jgi:hypothetical protein